eukprot:scaffold6323_cov121-Isochrysis_galbana.AAC.13
MPDAPLSCLVPASWGILALTQSGLAAWPTTFPTPINTIKKGKSADLSGRPETDSVSRPARKAPPV